MMSEGAADDRSCNCLLHSHLHPCLNNHPAFLHAGGVCGEKAEQTSSQGRPQPNTTQQTAYITAPRKGRDVVTHGERTKCESDLCKAASKGEERFQGEFSFLCWRVKYLSSHEVWFEYSWCPVILMILDYLVSSWVRTLPRQTLDKPTTKHLEEH